MRYYLDINADFKCLHCGQYISADALLAGVNNRNHCPYCLWSRHLDWYQAGDRLSACKAGMHPVGLTMKRSRNKYAAVAGGELMLVHQCIECESLSINRIAADDVPEVILEVFADGNTLSREIKDQIRMRRITLLGCADIDLVYRQLYGQLSPTMADLFTN
jgi:DNA-directed RNA polymerase subunit RPC12/RpoP